MQPHSLNNMKIQKYYQNELNLHVINSRNNLPKIKNGAHMKDWSHINNLDGYKLIATCYIALYVNGDNVTCLDSFGVEYTQKKITKFTGNKYITINIFKKQANDLIMCAYFLSLLDKFFPKKYKKE